ncbi:hypothetical protein DLE01_25580 [Streptomyces sp. FT05W]|nr:hypothetical protein DLE01_25580 [Streptomyces sp. FT05W]
MPGTATSFEHAEQEVRPASRARGNVLGGRAACFAGGGASHLPNGHETSVEEPCWGRTSQGWPIA